MQYHTTSYGATSKARHPEYILPNWRLKKERIGKVFKRIPKEMLCYAFLSITIVGVY
jgi:hypothetical protein